MTPFDLANVRRVAFYKRDELTTDLICCDVEVDADHGPLTWFYHEEGPDWQSWLDDLSSLVGFDNDWFAKVSQPPFERCETVAYVRPDLA